MACYKSKEGDETENVKQAVSVYNEARLRFDMALKYHGQQRIRYSSGFAWCLDRYGVLRRSWATLLWENFSLFYACVMIYLCALPLIMLFATAVKKYKLCIKFWQCNFADLMILWKPNCKVFLVASIPRLYRTKEVIIPRLQTLESSLDIWGTNLYFNNLY